MRRWVTGVMIATRLQGRRSPRPPAPVVDLALVPVPTQPVGPVVDVTLVPKLKADRS